MLRSSAVLLATLISATTSHGSPIDTCGTLTQGTLCILIQTDSGPSYVLSGGAPGHQVGERVRVMGDLDTACVTICIAGSGCVRSPQIGVCTPTCRADFDGSGAIGVQDIFSFLTAYFTNVTGPSPPGADFDGNGAITVNDIFAFLVAYFTGCP